MLDRFVKVGDTVAFSLAGGYIMLNNIKYHVNNIKDIIGKTGLDIDIDTVTIVSIQDNIINVTPFNGVNIFRIELDQKEIILNKILDDVTNKDLFMVGLPDSAGSFMMSYVEDKMGLVYDMVCYTMTLREVYNHYNSSK